VNVTAHPFVCGVIHGLVVMVADASRHGSV
jgi:hypothetical protein